MPNRLSVRERAVLIVLSFTLFVQGWTLGGFYVVADGLNFFLACFAFLLLWVPLRDLESIRVCDHARALLRSPLFWGGVLYFVYLGIQGLNPAFEVRKEANGLPRLYPLNHYSWLPAGVSADFLDYNLWRVGIIQFTAWLLVLTAWIGLRRRKSIWVLCSIIAASAFMNALVGVIQKGLGMEKIFGVIASVRLDFMGTFMYRNHAGAYYYLGLAALLALAIHVYRRAVLSGKRTSSAPLLLVLSGVPLLGVGLSNSRGAWVVTVLLVWFCFALWFGFNLKHRRWVGTIVSALFLISIIFGGAYLMIQQAEKDGMTREKLLTFLHAEKDGSAMARYYTTQTTWQMFLDKPLTGWGAGSFRSVFPYYQEKQPKILYAYGNRQYRYFWLHAHNDWAERFAELGVIGSLLLLGLPACALLFCAFNYAHLTGFSLTLLAGVFALAIHATVDFIFACPPLLITGGFMLCIASLEVRYRKLR